MGNRCSGDMLLEALVACTGGTFLPSLSLPAYQPKLISLFLDKSDPQSGFYFNGD